MAYIKKEDAIKAMNKAILDGTWSMSDRDVMEKMKQNVEALPTADVVEVKQIEIIRDDLKWWLETNTEKGVVFIPEFVVENMITKMDGGKGNDLL